MKFLYKKPVTQIITCIAGVYILYYLYWRLTSTLNYSAVLFSLLLLVAEIHGAIEFLLFAFMTWDVSKDKEDIEPPAGLTVDVFVPTYNEDLAVLESTVLGCINMRYEHTTYILDDGRRAQVEELAQKLGCEYLTRQDNKHAKAGNINAALKKTNGEFIVILDADMVPHPDFIEKTLGYFNDKKTAIVQLPQEFYNRDSAQHTQRAADWHEQQLFYHIIQIGKNRVNSSFWCGSPSIVRRAALESIGGVATESITEDFLSSIKLNSKGWKIKYHHEVLAFGIAPQSIYAFNLQRLRWAQGAMKILKSKNCPLIAPNLTLGQRLSHFSAIFTYFSSYQKLIYLLVPSIYLFTGVLPLMVTDGFTFLIHWVPYFCLVLITNIALGRGYFKYFDVEKYNTIKMFTFIRASFSLFMSKSLTFNVTPKTVDKTIRQKEQNEVKKLILLLILILSSVVFGALNILDPLSVTYPSIASAAAAIFWALFNSSIIIAAVCDVFRRLFNRQNYRFSFRTKGSIVEPSGRIIDAEIEDISLSGLGLELSQPEPVGSRQTVRLYLPDGALDLTGTVAHDRTDRNSARKLGLKFDTLPFESETRLYKFLYVTVPRYLYDNKGEHDNCLVFPSETKAALNEEKEPALIGMGKDID